MQLNSLIIFYTSSVLVYAIVMNYYYVTKLMHKRPLTPNYSYVVLTLGLIVSPLMLLTMLVQFIVGKLTTKEVTENE